jgi:hypothetical protein
LRPPSPLISRLLGYLLNRLVLSGRFTMSLLSP